MLIKDINELKNADFVSGVTMLVDKPLHWTSFDVVNKIRNALKKKTGIKRMKVGHAGTLDPLATGLLIIAIGKDTKKLEQYQNLDKEYSGTMRLGATTKTYDSEFEPDAFFPVQHIDEALLRETAKKFTGVVEQTPPKFSAVKIKGKAAYKLARDGQEFELKKRKVEIYDFNLKNISLPDVDFEVKCQKGTYIRSLVHDFGKALNSGAYLFSLRRTATGPHKVDDAFDLDEVIRILNSK